MPYTCNGHKDASGNRFCEGERFGGCDHCDSEAPHAIGIWVPVCGFTCNGDECGKAGCDYCESYGLVTEF